MKLFTSTDIQKLETAKVIADLITSNELKHYNTHLYYIVEEASQVLGDLYYERLDCNEDEFKYQLKLFNFKDFREIEALDKKIQFSEKILNDLFNKDFD